jgi:putative hemolysin
LAEQHHLVFPESAEYESLAGFVLSQLQRIPRGGEIVTHQDWRLTIVDMDGRRIARVKVERRGRSEGPTRPKEGFKDPR